MTAQVHLGELALFTLKNPQDAAKQILSWRFDRGTLWTALALVAVINTLIFTLSNILVPVQSPLGPAFDNPVIFLFVVAGGLVLTVSALFWTGRMLGAQDARFDDLLTLMIWLQALRAVAQAAVLVLMLVSPALAMLLVMAAGIAALWLLVNFVNVALKLDSMMRAVMVLIASTLAVVLGLSVLLSMIGVTAVGIPGNV